MQSSIAIAATSSSIILCLRVGTGQPSGQQGIALQQAVVEACQQIAPSILGI